MPQPIILEETFLVERVDPDGRVYQRVSRMECVSATGALKITSDINVEEFPIAEQTYLVIALATTLNLDGSVEKKVYDHSIYHRDTLLNRYDYAMHGRVYDLSMDEGSGEVVAHISFGGLLTKVEGSSESLKDIQFNTDLFLLVKRASQQ